MKDDFAEKIMPDFVVLRSQACRCFINDGDKNKK